MVHSFADPVLEKELLTALRSRVVLWGGGVLCFALSVVAIFAVAIVSDEARGRPLSVDGREAFGAFSLFLIPAMGLFAMLLAAPAVAEERESRTLDVLLSSRLSPWQIIWGKYRATMVATGLLAFGSLPAAAACFSMGGVRIHEALAAYVIALTTAAACGALGLMASSVTNRTRGAMSLAGVLFLVVVGPIGIVLLAGATSLFFDHLLGTTRVLWPSVMVVIGSIVSLVWTSLALAQIKLSPPRSDRSTPVRRAFLGTLVLGALTPLLIATVPDGTHRYDVQGAAIALGCASVGLLIMLLVQTLFLATEALREPGRARGLLASGSKPFLRMVAFTAVPALVVAGWGVLLVAGYFESGADWRGPLGSSSSFLEHLVGFGGSGAVLGLYFFAIAATGAWLATFVAKRRTRALILGLGTVFTLLYPTLAMPLAEFVGSGMESVWTLSWLNPVLGVVSTLSEADHGRITDLMPLGVPVWLWFVCAYGAWSIFATVQTMRARSEARP